ncbi:YdcF family protein [Arthrobacter sp. PM3]|uniref:YdcF family protein n=1 Tax=Arthrobacter sp. PM3 TaxID=2017685 RepID=UPI0021C2F586|nr:YdcF family protein [Arthrobacter sp. PM3]
MLPSVAAVNTATRRVLAFAAGGFLVWLIVACQMFVNVDPLSVHRTDAVIVLGGAASERLPVARRFQDEFHIPVLVISHTDTVGNRAADDACNAAAFPNSAVVCFRPPGLDTRGEAQAVSRLIAANGWRSVTVVTSSYHVTRAGRLIRQCTTADVQMVASHPDLDFFQWIRRFVVETGGLMDASFRPECANYRPEM